ncbi:MAG: VOC family protein [Deltaproteobacteria bacterium]|nr:VOC family protein [Deltaproteobacteria bacterium]MBW2084921.1 VOC family protein [Deltaproteobacteria bacterium]
MIKHLDHIGVAVESLDKVKEIATSAFRVDFPRPEGEGDFKASWVRLGNVLVEFMEPIASDGVIGKFLKNRGEGVHHHCFEVDDIEAEVESYLAQGLELVRPGIVGRQGWRVAFFHPKSTFGMLIELVQTRI